MALPAEKTRYTFADVLSWDEDERIEIIDGEAFMMATPSSRHQEISGELFRQLANFLEGSNARFTPLPSVSGCLSKPGTGRKMLIRWLSRTCRGM